MEIPHDRLLFSSGGITWSVDGVETISVATVEEGDMVCYELTCRSFHLTSFAILVDVYNVTSVRFYFICLLGAVYRGTTVLVSHYVYSSET